MYSWVGHLNKQLSPEYSGMEKREIMSAKKATKTDCDIITPFRVANGKRFRLKSIKPGFAKGLDQKDEKEVRKILAQSVQQISELQEKLHTTGKFGILLIFQGMDTSGKDGAIKHVMSGINPQGCQTFSFKAPSAEELTHDPLWRCTINLPGRGKVAIFNRSYYEETLVVRVHPELLQKQGLPEISDDIWEERFEDFRSFERYLRRSGIIVCKFFLHVSKNEQKKRLLDRLNTPEKTWKFSAADLKERKFWDDYQKAYEDMIRNTATKNAPWYVIPANKRWFARAVVASVVVDAMKKLDLKHPTVDKLRKKELAAARKALLSEQS